MVDHLSSIQRHLQLFYEISLFSRVRLIICVCPDTPATLLGRSRVVASAG